MHATRGNTQNDKKNGDEVKSYGQRLKEGEAKLC